ncbi:MAG: hypothetical protein DCF22_25190 [Leptolyngbya sp.]|nr:MAG: hypothetical protein DCF22_25190 [Leptolyngbya sp.]
MGRRVREKNCDRCTQQSSIFYRVQQDDTKTWVFICPACWKVVSQNNPLYIYGGTWKAKKP